MPFVVIFLILLFSYQFKHAISLPFDLTLLASALVFLLGGYHILKEKPSFYRKDMLWLLFFLWCFLSFYWSPFGTNPIKKTLALGLYTLPAFLAARFILLPHSQRKTSFLYGILGISSIVTLSVLITFFTNPLTSIILGNNYLVAGQSLGIGMLILASYPLSPWIDKIKPYGVGLFLLALFLLPGRGPLLFGLLSLSVYHGVEYFKNPQSFKTLSKTGIVYLLFLALGFVLTYLKTGTALPLSIQKASMSSSLVVDNSILERFDYYQKAIHLFIDHPFFGGGFGSWPLLSGLGDVDIHPHNLFLEIASETGVIGLLLLISYLMSFRRPTLWTTSSLLSLMLFCFLNAMKSGDLNDNYFFLVFLGLSTFLPEKKKSIIT